MKKYQYQVLRYVHDQFTGEFVNVGVVVYSPQESFLKAAVCQRFNRITSLFPAANWRFVSKLVKSFERSIVSYSNRHQLEYETPDTLFAITKTILPPDDSALVLTEVRFGIDIDMESALRGLFDSLVDRYISSNEQSLSDDDVWRKKYKSYFDQYKITEKLVPHNVDTKNDTIKFDKAWKNEIWHFYQPISFDLQNNESIKNKVYRWSGILREMDTAHEKVHITFLAILPKHQEKMYDFITQALDTDSESLKVELVQENEAENLARRISAQMQEHFKNN